EQRIGRVHRIGQREPVRVVNFVAKGTIEEGMMSVIKFKKSLFAGVLDAGDKDIFLGGTKLNKFMETVEKTTSAIPDSMLEDAEEALTLPRDIPTEPEEAYGRRVPAQRRRGVQPTLRAREMEPVITATEEELAETSVVSAPAADPLSSLLQAGIGLLQQLAS